MRVSPRILMLLLAGSAMANPPEPTPQAANVEAPPAAESQPAAPADPGQDKPVSVSGSTPVDPSSKPVETIQEPPHAEGVAEPAKVTATPAKVANPPGTKQPSRDEAPSKDAAKSTPSAPRTPALPDWAQGITKVRLLDGGPPRALEVGQTATTVGKGIQVLTPYPVRALSPVPAGWELAAAPDVPATLRRVSLDDGRVLEFMLSAPVLVPANPQAVALKVPSPDLLAGAKAAQLQSRQALVALANAIAAQLPQTREEDAAEPPAAQQP